MCLTVRVLINVGNGVSGSGKNLGENKIEGIFFFFHSDKLSCLPTRVEAICMWSSVVKCSNAMNFDAQPINGVATLLL